MSNRFRYALAWVVATLIAIAVGVATVSTVGASLEGRGPLGGDVTPDSAPAVGTARPDSQEEVVREIFAGRFGRIVVECQGLAASTISVEPNTADGWRVVSYEPGPDDDVDATFGTRRGSIDLEVFCNRGKPTLAEIERNALPDD